jgi:hypothetical protein
MNVNYVILILPLILYSNYVCNVCMMDEALLDDMVRIQITKLVKWLCTPAWLSEVLRTRTSVGGPNTLGGFVTRVIFFICVYELYAPE